jgi:hypothetical protein
MAADDPSRKTEKVAGSTFPTLEMFKIKLPTFDFPTVEMPSPFREMAEQARAQAQETIQKIEKATSEAGRLIETSSATAASGVAEYNQKLVEVARTNSQSVFAYALALLNAKSMNEVVELSSAQLQNQFQLMSDQTKELAGSRVPA